MKASNIDVKKLKKKKKKGRKRLIFLIVILLFLILLTALIWKRNYIVKNLLENTIAKLVKADISLTSIDINSQGIYFEDLKVESKTDIYYYLDTPKLNIELNYSSLFNRKQWLKEAIDSVYIETPSLSYKQKFEKSKNSKKKKKKSTPDNDEVSFNINNYLRKATINQASLSFEVIYSEYFGIKDSFSQADLTFDNSRENTLMAEMLDNRKNIFEANLGLNNQGLSFVSANANGYNPDSLFVPVAKDIEVDLYGSGMLNFKEDDDLYLTLDMISKQSSANLFDMALVLKNIKITGDSHNLAVSPETASFMGIPVKVQGNLINLFNDLEIEAKAKINKHQISKSYNFMSGLVSADVNVSGFAENLHITGKVNSDSLDFNSLAVTNIVATLDFQEQLQVRLVNAEFDKNILTGEGLVCQNCVSANLLIKNKEASAITLQGNLNTKGVIIDGNSYFRLLVSDFTVGYNGILLPPISGLLSLDEDILKGELYNESISLKLNTNLTFTDSKVSVDFTDFHTALSFPLLQEAKFAKFNPLLNGKITLSKDNDDVAGKLNLDITALDDKIYLPLKTDFSWNLNTKKIDISNTIMNGKIFNQKTKLLGQITIDKYNQLNANLSINDDIIIKGDDLLNANRKLKLQINQIALNDLKEFLPAELTVGYPEGYITLDLDYFWSSDLIAGDFIVTGIQALGLSGYGLKGHFAGNLERIRLNELIVYNERQILVTASGSIETTNGLVVNVNALVNEIDFTDYQNLIPLKGFFEADLNFRYDSKDEEKYKIRLKGVGSDFKIADFDITDIYFNLLYTHQNIHVDNFYLNSVNYAELNIIGDFSYDLFKNEFIPSNNRLYIKLDADVYNLLNKLAPKLFKAGEMALRSELIIGIGEEGLDVYEGYIVSEDGFLQIVDQPERVDNINILATMNGNKLDLEKFELKLGDGYLRVANMISEDSDNFFVGNFILGQFKFFTSQRGLLAHIPEYMPKNATALIKIEGRRDNYASIKGPFDDMKIDAEITVSNASIIYPPKTENLLSIVTSASKNTFKKKEKVVEKKSKTRNALPFELDVKLIVGENTKYITYPTNITVTPNSYLVLTYKNNEWLVPDAKFIAEEGTVTFLDTDFDVELVEILINEIDLSIGASFVKRVQDGSTVTLMVSNEQSNQVGLENLTLTLLSDNPNDKTQAQAINRLRSGDNSYDLPQADQNALQDETMLMLGSNVDNSFFNSFLRPTETFFRKTLRLDYFYIKPGFVKNMVNNYVLDNQTNQINSSNTNEISESELVQFSSSILLNNLTVNFGRPVYKRLYFNYEGFFQETTNLNKKTKIFYDQDFQLRTNVDFKTKMSYTFKYKPSGTNSHEVMLFHSINF